MSRAQFSRIGHRTAGWLSENDRDPGKLDGGARTWRRGRSAAWHTSRPTGEWDGHQTGHWPRAQRATDSLRTGAHEQGDDSAIVLRIFQPFNYNISWKSTFWFMSCCNWRKSHGLKELVHIWHGIWNWDSRRFKPFCACILCLLYFKKLTKARCIEHIISNYHA